MYTGSCLCGEVNVEVSGSITRACWSLWIEICSI